MDIKGLKKLEQKLKRMEKKDAKKAVRAGVRIAQKVGLQATKANATSMIGGDMGAAIAKATKVKAVWKQKKGGYALQIAIDPNKAEEFKHTTASGDTFFIPTAIEYGFKHVSGKQIPANPYARTAAESTAQQRLNKLISTIKKGLK